MQVRKDVLRTDRSHPFYVSKLNMDTEQQNDITSSVSTYSSILTQFDAQTNDSSMASMNSSYTAPSVDEQTGIDQQVGVYENRNVQALTNVLVTYALNHKVGYWQGMSDLCSPILLAIRNEADTYICFAALMRRLTPNFDGDECMAKKFDLLRKLLRYYDPEFFDYLEQQQAGDLLFCYRWLLLELKREFKLDHAIYMLEGENARAYLIFWLNPPRGFLSLNRHLSNRLPFSLQFRTQRCHRNSTQTCRCSTKNSTPPKSGRRKRKRPPPKANSAVA